ncbi:hypothetical protein Poli38472_005470 [Pythium oligandrum]|uniref:Trichohyalin-plectin-homology domain-containing protein n=1 Tax=Pythium oligandrum TaxID=41045 RepID=A0A8K1FKI2_PYTOL|nr:hypothetical protein Poli38472_005470 [Pythium oligandrum]|eukprot:TMW62852.1 hypothetical protein Poli38472_005470 [Pythium oligandrum]
MPSTTTLSSDELERILASVSAPAQSNREARRQELKSTSEQRKSQWPNTLEAMRKKKDRWKKDKEEREEEARKKIDEEEMRLQKEARTKQIERANRLLNEQTDRMKSLRSKQLLADVVHHRKLQLAEKAMLKAEDDMVKYEYDREVLEGVLRGEEEEQREHKRRLQEHEKLAKIQKQQLEEYKQRYIDQLREEKREGELTKMKAEADYKEELEKERQRRLIAKQESEETKLANMRLKEHQRAQKELERLEDVKREEDEKKKKERDAKRDQFQREKREKAQARKQRMIDLATQNLQEMALRVDNRLQSQSKEVQEKEDRDLQVRSDRRAMEKEAIHRSRQSQLEHKAEHKDIEKHKVQENIRQWEEYGKRIELQARQEEQDVRLENLRFAVSQKQQADARRKTIMEERAAELLLDNEAKTTLAREGEKFHEAALQALEEAKARGLENLVPIKKALTEKRIELLPASGFRI